MAALRFSLAHRHGQDAVDSARFWIERAHHELSRPDYSHLTGVTPLWLGVRRALFAVDLLMMALGVTKRSA